jgi:hypothetical protein
MKEDKNRLGDTVGHIIAKRKAIDETPIYYFLLTENLGAGRTIRWDSAELKITVEDITNNA